MAEERIDIDILINATKSAKDVKDLKQAIDSLKQASSSVKEGTADYEKFHQALNAANEDLLIKTAESATSVGDLRKAIKALQSAALEAGVGSNEFKKYTVAAADAKDRLGDVQENIAALDPDNKAQQFVALGSSIAGAFQIATGAATLLGLESEKAQKIMLKLQAVTAIAQGFQSLKDAVKAYTMVQRVLNQVMEGNIWMKIVAVILLIAGLLYPLIQRTQVFKNIMSTMSDIFSQLQPIIDLMADNFKKMGPVITQLIEIALMPLYLQMKAISWIIGSVTKLLGIQGDETKKLNIDIEALNAVYDKHNETIQKAKSQSEDFIRIRKAQGASENEVTQLTIQALKAEEKARQDVYKKALEIREQLGHLDEKQQELFNKVKDSYEKSSIDVQVAEAEAQTKRRQQGIDAAKKMKDEISKLEKDLTNAQIQNIQDENEKKRAELQNEYNNRVKDLTKLELDEINKLTGLKRQKALLEYQLKQELTEKYNNDLYEFELKIQYDKDKRLLNQQLKDLEDAGQSTYAKQLEIAQFERDFILNNTLSTEEEKLRAKEDYKNREKDLTIKHLKELDGVIKEAEGQITLAAKDEFEKRFNDIQNNYNKQLTAADKAYNAKIEKAKLNGQDTTQIEQDYNDLKLKIAEDYHNKLSDLEDAKTKDRIQKFSNTFSTITDFVSQGLNILQTVSDTQYQTEKYNLEKSMKDVESRYDLEINAAKKAGKSTEELEKKKALAVYQQKKKLYDLEKQQFENNKKMQIADTVIKGLAGAASAIAQNPPPSPVGLISAALIAGNTIATVAQIDSTQFTGEVPTIQIPDTGSAGSIQPIGTSAGVVDTSSNTFNPDTIITGSELNTQQEIQGIKDALSNIKVVVLESDITNTQNTVQAHVSGAQFG